LLTAAAEPGGAIGILRAFKGGEDLLLVEVPGAGPATVGRIVALRAFEGGGALLPFGGPGGGFAGILLGGASPFLRFGDGPFFCLALAFSIRFSSSSFQS
jgi:hypothetical protein